MDLKTLTEGIGDLGEDKVMQLLKDFVVSNPSEEEGQDVIVACQKGMEIVGDLFEKGVYFVGDLIFAGELLVDAIEVLKPAIGNGNSTTVGKIVLGTVQGDIHDIGKNIFKIMSQAAGFEVIDIGIDQPVSAFVEKVKEVKPNIVGLSGVLTLTLEAMKNTVDGLKEAGIRDSVKIIIGGNAISNAACVHIGADEFTRNAAEGVKISLGWVR